MSIKSELRLLEKVNVYIQNPQFYNDITSWEATGWTMSSYENSAKSDTGTTTIEQIISLETRTDTYYKIDFRVIRNSGGTITPYIGSISGTSVTDNGLFSQTILIPSGTTDQTIRFETDTNFNGNLTNISLQKYNYDEYGIQLYDDISYNLNFAIFSIENLDKSSSTYSKTITIPGTKRNNQIFSHLYDIDIEVNTLSGSTDTFFNKRIDCQLLYDGLLIKEGFFELQKVYYNESIRQIEYEGEFYSKGKTFSENVGDKLITGNKNFNDDLDFSFYNHRLELQAIEYSYNESGTLYPNSKGYFYPFLDYTNKTSGNVIKLEDLRPAIYVKEIIDKIFEKAGYTYDSIFFNSSFFKKLIVPFYGMVIEDSEELNNRNLKIGLSNYYSGDGTIWTYSAGGDGSIEMHNFASISPELNSNSNEYLCQVSKIIPLDNDTDPFYNSSTGAFNTINHQWVIDKSGKYSITYTSSQWCYIADWVGGYHNRYIVAGGEKQTLHEIQLWKINNGIHIKIATLKERKLNPTQFNVYSSIPEWTSTLTATFDLYAGDIIYVKHILSNYSPYFDINGIPIRIHEWLIVDTETAFVVEAQQGYKLYEGSQIEMNKMLPKDIRQMDFFKSIVNMFNLMIDENPLVDNRLIIEPRNDYYISGTTIDWTNKEDKGFNQEIERIPTLINKDFHISYQEDTDDYNETYKNDTGGGIYGESNIKNPYISNETYEIEQIFSPTPLGSYGGTNWITSKIFKTNERGEVQNTDFKPRILIRDKLSSDQSGLTLSGMFLRSELENTSIAFGGQYWWSSSIRRYQPYAGHFDNPYHPNLDLNFDICKEYFLTFSNYTGTTLTGITTNNLFRLYWQDYIAELMDLNSKRVTKQIKLDITDITNLNFANTILIDNVYYYLEKIEDWNPGELTKVYLLKTTKYDLNLEVPSWQTRFVPRIIPSTASSVLNLQSSQDNVDMWDYSTTGETIISGNTYYDTVNEDNYFDPGGTGIIIGDGNIINGDEYIILGDNNNIGENTTNIFIGGDDIIVGSGLTNIYVFGGSTGTTINTSNVVVIPSGMTLVIEGEISGLTSGSSGSSGESGTSGTSGSSGISGISGTSGTSGVSGTSGTSGLTGTSGTSGLTGTSGTSGVGSPGTSGTSGLTGTSGTSGIGPTGDSGTSGTSGLTGTSGTSGSSGSSGLSNLYTYDIDFYYDTITDTLYDPNIHITGQAGSVIIDNILNIEDNNTKLVLSGGTLYQVTGTTAGATGTSGTSGVGSPGTSGTSGVNGTSGINGTSGTSGLSGTSGTSGINGTSGTSGVNGTSGTSGKTGTSGSSGISPDVQTDVLFYYLSGNTTMYVPHINITDLDIINDNNTKLIAVDGLVYSVTGITTGTSGINGTSGTSGKAGTSGTSGKAGTSGTSGATGTSGTSGTSGISGTSGTSGLTGTSGTSGATGTSGTSGATGTSGSSGKSGISDVEDYTWNLNISGETLQVRPYISAISDPGYAYFYSGVASYPTLTNRLNLDANLFSTIFTSRSQEYGHYVNIIPGVIQIRSGNDSIYYYYVIQAEPQYLQIEGQRYDGAELPIRIGDASGHMGTGLTESAWIDIDPANNQFTIHAVNINIPWATGNTFLGLDSNKNIIELTGTTGGTGTSGTSGTSGTDGKDAENGTSGTSGKAGTSGTSGDTGKDGTSGTSGTLPVYGNEGNVLYRHSLGYTADSGLTYSGKLDVTTPSATFANEVLKLHQTDADKQFISYSGATAATQSASISTANGTGTDEAPKLKGGNTYGWKYTGMIRIKINGNDYWMPYYDIDGAP